MDTLDLPRHSRITDLHHRRPTSLHDCGASDRFLQGIREHCAALLSVTSHVAHDHSSSCLPDAARLHLESVQEAIHASALSHRARDSSFQLARLSAAYGAIPESHKESQGDATDAEESRLCILSDGGGSRTADPIM